VSSAHQAKIDPSPLRITNTTRKRNNTTVLESLIQGKNITGNVSLSAFSKGGTSSLLYFGLPYSQWRNAEFESERSGLVGIVEIMYDLKRSPTTTTTTHSIQHLSFKHPNALILSPDAPLPTIGRLLPN
jgi:hypothetical protein